MAFDYWRALVEATQVEDPYRRVALPSVEDLAYLAGRDYAAPAAAPAPGPSAEDMAAATDMSPEEREAMIGSMVEGLAQRLAAEGVRPRLGTAGVVAGRARRPRAGVGDPGRGTDGLCEDAAAQDLLDEAARSAGVAE
jgi:cytochrome c-type biogenesis protein CcmH